MARVFLDTNVLAYLFDDNAPDKQRRAEEALRQSHDFVVSTQVMLELYQVLTRKFSPPLTASEGQAVLAGVAHWEVVAADAGLVLRATRTAADHQLSIWDAMILEAASFSHCGELWSEDLAAGSELSGVSIVNPFAAIAE